MGCNIFTDNIIQYLDKELNEEDRNNFEAHKQRCRVCQNVFNEVALTYLLISKEKHLDATPFFYQKLINTLETKQETSTISLIPKILKPIAIAASISIGVLIGNGEQNILLSPDNEFDLVRQSLSPILASDYSVWTTLNEENGSDD